MKLSRVNSKRPESSDLLAELLAKADLDVLQLDAETSLAENYSDRFLQELQNIHRFFFLDPNLRLITNSGGNDVVACTEALGTYLRDHGDAGMPITAIRGDNLLSRLPQLRTAGIMFNDTQSGELLLETSRPVLSAQVQIGAGALATALAEDSRMIVTGSYDPAAPFLAAGVALADLEWKNYDRLARLAIASQLATEKPLVSTIEESGEVSIASYPKRKLDWNEILSQIPDSLAYADVECDVSTIQVEPTEDLSYRLTDIQGSATDGNWQVRFTFLGDDSRPVVRWCQIPRDAIPLSVDTRPAAEWI